MLPEATFENGAAKAQAPDGFGPLTASQLILGATCMSPITLITASRSSIPRGIFLPSGAVTERPTGSSVTPTALRPTAAAMSLWSSTSTVYSSSMQRVISSKSGARSAQVTASSDIPAASRSLMAVCVRAAVSLWQMLTTTASRNSQARAVRTSVPPSARPGFAICAESAATKKAAGVFGKEKACLATSFTPLRCLSASRLSSGQRAAYFPQALRPTAVLPGIIMADRAWSRSARTTVCFIFLRPIQVRNSLHICRVIFSQLPKARVIIT